MRSGLEGQLVIIDNTVQDEAVGALHWILDAAHSGILQQIQQMRIPSSDESLSLSIKCKDVQLPISFRSREDYVEMVREQCVLFQIFAIIMTNHCGSYEPRIWPSSVLILSIAQPGCGSCTDRTT